MASSKKIIENAAQMLRLKFDSQRSVAYGVYSNYTMIINGIAGNRQHICVSLCASCNGVPINPGYMNASVRLPDKVQCSFDKFRTNLMFPVSGNVDNNVNKVVEIVRSMVDFFIANGCVNCDERGIIGFTSVYAMKGNYVLLTDESARILYASIVQDSKQEIQKSENYIGGIIGALLGAVVGALLILLIARMGRIATISGILMGIAIVFGYKKLGKKFSKISIVICALISVIMTYLTFRLDATIDLYSAFQDYNYNVTFSYCFTNTKWMYEMADSMSAYNHDLFLMMLVGVGGTLVALWLEYSNQKTQFEMYKLN